jgi:hypothetical protein
MFHPAPAPTQEDIELLVERASRRILRFLQRRGVITLITASKRQPIRVVLDPDERPVTKGALCGQTHGFNLQAATRLAANDKDGRERLCRYILRPPLANHRLSILDDGNVHLEFKRPWSNGTSSVDLAPLALIARLAALVPPPRRHTVLYCGVLSSHASARKEVVPAAPVPTPPAATKDKPKRRPKYIRWSDLLRRVFGIETICPTCQTPLRLISLIKSETIARKILVAMHLPANAPELHPARPPPGSDHEAREAEDWVN